MIHDSNKIYVHCYEDVSPIIYYIYQYTTIQQAFNYVVSKKKKRKFK